MSLARCILGKYLVGSLPLLSPWPLYIAFKNNKSSMFATTAAHAQHLFQSETHEPTESWWPLIKDKLYNYGETGSNFYTYLWSRNWENVNWNEAAVTFIMEFNV
jgi:hypothetical protein